MNANEGQRLDTVLQSLGSAKPDDMMQARLLNALYKSEAMSQSLSRSSLPQWLASAAPALARPVFALAAFLVIAGASLHLRHAQHHSEEQRTVSAAAPVTSAAVASVEARAQILQVAAKPNVPLQSTSIGKERHAGTSAQPASIPAPQPRMLTIAASFPAPPLPPTEQEQLLRRMVRHEQADQLAQLTQPAIEAATRQEKNAVTEFFVPLAPLRGQQEPPGYDQSAGLQ